jgi:hypothetical protein
VETEGAMPTAGYSELLSRVLDLRLQINEP